MSSLIFRNYLIHVRLQTKVTHIQCFGFVILRMLIWKQAFFKSVLDHFHVQSYIRYGSDVLQCDFWTVM